MTGGSPLHSIYMTLPADLSARLGDISKRLSEKYENLYLGECYIDFHITVLSFNVAMENSTKFLEEARNTLEVAKPVAVKLGDLGISSEGHDYIFLNPDAESKERIVALRDRLWAKLSGLRDAGLTEEQKEEWDGLSDEERQRITDTGSKHSFSPHISIIKMTPEEAAEAMESLDAGEFQGREFPADEIAVARGASGHEMHDPFRVLAKIKLK